MPDRLSSLDSSFLHMETVLTPMHVGSVLVFDPPPGGFDHERLVALISERIAAAPRYRQKVRFVPAGLANPLWVDDDRFDVTYHVRRSALPRPGTDEQLEELVARIMPRQLDRSRPLWEAYLVEGLADGRFAIITKTHHALVDGVDTLDIAQLVVDGAVPPTLTGQGSPTPANASGVDLLMDAALETLKAPLALADTVRAGLRDVRSTAGQVLEAAGEVLGVLARASTRPAPDSPLNGTIGRARRFVMIGTDLAEHRAIRDAASGGSSGVTVHDVVLTALTGAFRSWLLTRGETVQPGTSIRALVPVTVHDEESGEPAIVGAFVDLPIGEPSPVMRLHQVAWAMSQELGARRAVPADALAGMGGFAPPTTHALGARLGAAMTRRLANVVITNVPGPQQSLTAGGARMVSTFPVMPLSPGHALSVGLTSYDGGVFYGLYADRESLPDLDVLGHAVLEALDELADVTHAAR